MTISSELTKLTDSIMISSATQTQKEDMMQNVANLILAIMKRDSNA